MMTEPTIFAADAAPESYAASFATDGYLLMRGLLDPRRDIDPLRESYSSLIDAMGYVYLSETWPDALADYDAQPFPLRFATMLGASGGTALHHLDPVLNIFVEHFRLNRDLPTAQIPELFACIRHCRVLDVLEAVLGPEILASPIYHVNVKLAQRHLQEVEAVAKASGQDNPTLEKFYNFQVGKTDWHMDAISGLRDSHDSRIVNAWIPLTEATSDNGCLAVAPRQPYRRGVRPERPGGDGRTRGAPADAPRRRVVPGQQAVAQLDTQHQRRRLPLGVQLSLRAGRADGRAPLSAGLVARSRSAPESELHNPFVWSTMWDRALTYRVKHGVPYSYASLREGTVNEDQARAITEHWRRRAPDPQGWLRLEQADEAPLPAVGW